MAKNSKPVTKKGLKIFTGIMSAVVVVLLALIIAVPVVTTTQYDSVLRRFFGGTGGSGLELNDINTYNRAYYESEDYVQAAAREYFRGAAAEGYVLLENKDGFLPMDTSSGSTDIALFSLSSVNYIIGGTGSGKSSTDVTLKDAFEADGFKVNADLWNYYSGVKKTRGDGSASYGMNEDWSLNEVPLSTLQDSISGFSSIQNTCKTAFFIMSRTGGEGRDIARRMGDYAATEEEASSSYLEPDSVELEIIDYLNKNFTNVVLVLNTNNVMETGWIKDYDRIKSVIWAPGGGDQAAYALADLVCGKTPASGRLVDTMAYSAFSFPAMANFGDFAYVDSDGNSTGYYGVSYDEGIYVGYKYYETRYYDSVADGSGTNATSTTGSSTGSAWSYDTEVAYPFGYGMSYTDFTWSDYTVQYCGADGNEKQSTDTLAADDILKVSLTVTNTGSVADKDVVEIYASVPYTSFDKTNHIEKSAVSLVGFAKTDTLAAADADGNNGGSEEVEITVNVSDLASYDDVVNKTYILEAGDYYITAATDAHEAVNNVLAAQVDDNSVTISGGFSEGSRDLAAKFTPTPGMTVDESGVDAVTFAKSAYTGADITNKFDGSPSDGGYNYIDRDAYLSRQDWSGTWPKTHGTQEGKEASTNSEVNGYQYRETISADLLAKLKLYGTAEAANNPVSDDSITAEMAGSLESGGSLELIMYRGLAYEDADWMALASQMSTAELKKLVAVAGYETSAVESINKPLTTDDDGPAGLNDMVSGAQISIAYPAEVCIAATWNTEVSSAHGYFIGEDGLNSGVQGWYGPAMNIHRTPFGGRNFEYYSEDGFISGAMGSAAVKAAADKGIYAYAKHFALNDQEGHRSDNGVCSWCNEQAMRELYLQPFEMTVTGTTKAVSYYRIGEDGSYETDVEGNYIKETAVMPSLSAVMSSFNRVGATWAGGNYSLVTGILRNEWGYDGMVLTDYYAGAFMGANQEIRAGADAVLFNVGTGNVSVSSSADIYYCKQAASHILYTVVNSSAMNGYLIGTGNSSGGFAYYYLLVIAIDVVCAAGIALCAVFVTRRWLRYRKSAPDALQQ